MRGATPRVVAMLIVTAAFLVLGGSGALAHGDGSKTLVVDDNLACPNAQYTSIQAAVTAANAGDTVLVCPGVYNEQVRIPKPLTVRGIEFKNEDAPIVRPAVVLPNSTSLSSGNPIAAIVLAEAKDVDVSGLTIDGSLGGITGCAPNYVGMYYRNASGEFEHNAVTNIRLAPALFGCQSGQAIFVQSGNGGRSNVEITANTVHDYQKTGILANEAGTNVTVVGNTVSGFGVTPDIAQNGVQIGAGATGVVTKNSVINHLYGLCNPTTCGAVSTNVLVFGTQGVAIYDNVLGKAQVNVYLEADKSKVEKNLIFDTDVFDGVYVEGDYNRIVANAINTSDEAAIWLNGTKNLASWNVINETPEGIHDQVGGNSLGFNAYYNVVQKRAPAPTALTTTTLATPTDEVEETTIAGLPSLRVPTALPVQP